MKSGRVVSQACCWSIQQVCDSQQDHMEGMLLAGEHHNSVEVLNIQRHYYSCNFGNMDLGRPSRWRINVTRSCIAVLGPHSRRHKQFILIPFLIPQ